ncbi:MAG: hypothetical protein EPN19_16450 [Betaproteobacteria bacterium]|nr:MAG: hypothetical protein EPN19_16450 [Betaproteobacteria bacterium]
MGDTLLRDWVRRWADTGKELEAIRRRELEAMTDEQAREAALDLLTMPLPVDLPPRLESGLVEQQRWFSKLRRKA